MVTLRVNGETHQLEVDPQMPLLWALRENLKLSGTKFGCGMAQCGACTVHLNGQAIRSCVTPVAAAMNGEVTTIEGIGQGDELHPVQQAWIAEQVPQCGYCQSGQIMSAVALLKSNAKPSSQQINQAMEGNLCRCANYLRIKDAIKDAAKTLEDHHG